MVSIVGDLASTCCSSPASVLLLFHGVVGGDVPKVTEDLHLVEGRNRVLLVNVLGARYVRRRRRTAEVVGRP